MKLTFNIFFLGVIFALVGCSQGENNEAVKSQYSAKTFSVANDQFGYDIFKDSVKIIHQPIIPSVAGNNGFNSEEDAKKVANLMIAKLDKGLMPPSVTVEELDSLGIKTLH